MTVALPVPPPPMDAAAESVGEVEGLAVCVPEPLPERLGVPLAVAVGLGDGGTQAQAPVLSVMRAQRKGRKLWTRKRLQRY